MTDKKVAIKDLSKLLASILERLSPGNELDRFKFQDSWQQYKIARLRLFVGDLEIEATKFDADFQGVIDVHVWNFNDIEELMHKFRIKGRIPHVARVVADYVNEYEGE